MRTLNHRYVVVVIALILVLGDWYVTPVISSHPSHVHASYPIKHIIIMVKENRTFDTMFGTFPGANGATKYTDQYGKVHSLNHEPDRLDIDPGHIWQYANQAYDH